MISVVDIFVICTYLSIMLVIGYLSGRNNKSQEDYFLGSRSMPWIPVGLSVAATMISANGFIGGPGWAYNDGMYPVMVNIAVPFAIFISLWITTPVIYKLKVTSVYEYMEVRLGTKSRNLAIIQFFINSLIQVSSMVFIPALIIQTLTGWSLYTVVPIIVIISILYTLMGGIKAVIWTDTIQMVVVIGGVILVIVTALNGIDANIFDTLGMIKASGKLNTLDFSTNITLTNTFWATLIGGSIMWIRYFCFDQAQVQRILTSKSLKEAKNSLVVSSIIMNMVYYLMLFIGVILFVFYGGRVFDTSNEIMITFIINELPIGIIGLIIAGVFAAAMSSIDSLLNSMTTVFTKDIYEYYFKKDDKETSLKLSMIITVFIGLLIIAFVILGFGGTAKSILDVVGNYISYFAGPATGAFILAMFTYKSHDNGVASGFIIGLVGGYIIAKIFNTSWLWNPAIGSVITIISGYLLSIIIKSKQDLEKVKRYTAMGMRQEIMKDGKTTENGVSTLPFAFGKHEIIALSFFIFQYVILFVIQYS
ncbi:MAG: sodium/solute symporter [Clostridium sp.]|uniref:sodium:solute symporter family transporter n=1 Tax=Clostridium sp. TaxID=1506 RepID=UPI00303C69A3